MKDNTFADIKIVGADEELTHAPDASRPMMYDVYLKLSDSPPHEWVQAFEQAWRHRLYSKKRRARIEGEHLVIHCPLDEIEKDHKPELLAVLAQVNQDYKQYAAQQTLLQERVTAQEAAADQKKKNTLGGLKFE
jgi:hypothetical protein